MSDLAAAAANVGGPEDLVMRSARARAEATGASVDDILAAWAGGASAPTSTTEAAPTDAPEAAPIATDEPVADEPAPATLATVATAAAPTSTPVPAPALAPPPVPETVSIEESYSWDQVTTARTAGLKERTKSVIPTWLLALFTVIPLFAVGYMTINSGGPTCGDAGQLAIDFNNELVNCDLTAYEGIGGGVDGQANFIAIGGAVFSGKCASCHGANGQGISGPQLSGGSVAATFGSCSDHVTWVNLGTNGWRDEIGDTYGDTSKPVGGGGLMSGWADLLTEEEIQSVVLYERVAFGGITLDTALEDCGLVTSAEETPEDEAPLEEPAEEPAP